MVVSLGPSHRNKSLKNLKKQYNLSIDKRKIQLEQNLASLGYHHVAAKLHHDVTAKLNVHVVEG